MPRYLRVSCPCGRALRARPEQAGSTIRCWDCGGQAAVPYPHLGGRVVRAMGDAVVRSRGGDAFGPVLAGALAIAAVLCVPTVGPWLGLAALAGAVALWYGPMVRQAGRDLCEPRDHLWGDVRDANPADDPRLFDTEEIAALLRERTTPPPSRARRLRSWGVRIALGVLAAAALAAPVVVRNGGLRLPVDAAFGPRAVLVALAGWAVVPIVFLLAFAHDRRGRLPARSTLAALLRHPLATASSLLLPVVGLVLIEALLALAAWDQGFLAVMTADFSPPPHVTGTSDGTHLHLNYDGRVLERNISAGPVAMVDVYPVALAHGYSLVGNLPLSLSRGLAVRMNPAAFWVNAVPYFLMRLVLTAVALTLLGALLALQGRWLGVIASLGARRPRVAYAPATGRTRLAPPFPTTPEAPTPALQAQAIADEPAASSPSQAEVEAGVDVEVDVDVETGAVVAVGA